MGNASRRVGSMPQETSQDFPHLIFAQQGYMLHNGERLGVGSEDDDLRATVMDALGDIVRAFLKRTAILPKQVENLLIVGIQISDVRILRTQRKETKAYLVGELRGGERSGHWSK